MLSTRYRLCNGCIACLTPRWVVTFRVFLAVSIPMPQLRATCSGVITECLDLEASPLIQRLSKWSLGRTISGGRGDVTLPLLMLTLEMSLSVSDFSTYAGEQSKRALSHSKVHGLGFRAMAAILRNPSSSVVLIAANRTVDGSHSHS